MVKKFISYKTSTIIFGSLLAITMLASTFDLVIGRFLMNDESRSSYALGVDIAEGFIRQGIDIHSSAFKMGIEHGLSSKSKITAQQKEQYIEIAKRQAKAQAQKVADERAEFLKNEMEKLKSQGQAAPRRVQASTDSTTHFGPKKDMVGPKKNSNDLPTRAPVDLKK